eukprot:3793874-Rhodomonas_salina.5
MEPDEVVQMCCSWSATLILPRQLQQPEAAQMAKVLATSQDARVLTPSLARHDSAERGPGSWMRDKTSRLDQTLPSRRYCQRPRSLEMIVRLGEETWSRQLGEETYYG